MRNWITLLLFILFTRPVSAQIDAATDAVYALAKIPAPLGVYNHVIQARIINTGINEIIDLPVTVTVTGANNYTDTKLVSIPVSESVLVNFNPYSSWILGTNIVTVTIPDDENNSNNIAICSQEVNSNSFAYADASPPSLAVGYGTGEGMLLTRYTVTGSGQVNQVRVFISNQADNIGNTVYGVVNQFGMIVGQSAGHVITASDLGTYISFDIINPPAVDDEFYVGLLQLPAVGAPFYPVACQVENIPTRPGAFYASLPDGSGLTEVSYIGRFMIEAIVGIGNDLLYASASNQKNYVLAGWDFSGSNSPVNFAATTYDTSLSSSGLLTRGPAASATAGYHSFRTASFLNDGISTSNTDYFQFNIAPKQHDTISLASIGGYLHGNSSLAGSIPVSSQFAYSLDGVNFTLIGNSFNTENNVETFNVNLSGIADLQNINSSTTVTFRYYASGEVANGDWGFTSVKPGSNGLYITGKLVSGNSIITAPVVPTGAAFTLSNCSSTATGSISFTTAGNFSPTNKYEAQLVRIYQPSGNAYRIKYPVTIGSITSNATSGTINFTIPEGTSAYDQYAIRVNSTEPYVAGSFSHGFSIVSGYCNTLPEDNFRSKTSGNWDDLGTWESSDGNTWIQATLLPDDAASQVEISHNDTVSVTSNVAVTNTTVKGVLKIVNNSEKKGVLAILNPKFPQPISLKIDTSGTLLVISENEVYTDVITYNAGRVRVIGKITIGDGVHPQAPGFDNFATDMSANIFWFDGAIFNWDSPTSFPTDGVTFFPQEFSSPVMRISSIAPGFLGGNNNTTINGLFEANTPVSWSGTGVKIFRDGIKGNSVITQAAGSGQMQVNAEFQDIPASNSNNACKKGIIAGSVSINLASAGLLLTSGITIPDTSHVNISGPVTALQTTTVQPGASLNLVTGSEFTLDNADLLNEGIISGTGLVKFIGSNTSAISSTGLVSAPIELIQKDLVLGDHSNIRSLSLTNSSKLTLGVYNLNIDTANIVFDDLNYIITNDTGRLSRYAAANDVTYPIGISNISYTPVTITNSGTADHIKVRVTSGVQSTIPIISGNVDRTWFIGDSTQTGLNILVKMQWNSADEQPDFNRNNCYIAQYVSCALTGICPSSFDTYPATAASGTTIFQIERSAITGLRTPAFIVSSKQFVYTFTGNGDWNDAANWTPAVVAPVTIPESIEVYINPAGQGVCEYNGNIKIKPGGKLKVEPGKKLTINGNIIIE